MRPHTLDQPGSNPPNIPQQEPNPAYAPKREEPNFPSPSREREPSRREPERVPEKV